nr:MAG: RNA-dependent RNA polymerase [Riboviria sp.]
MHDIELDIFLKLAWEVGTPVAYKAILMAERGDWLGLSRIDVRPHHYCDASNYLQDAQIASFFKKLPGLATGLDLEAKAITDFWDSEHQCYHTNERLSPLLFDLGHYGEPLKKLLLDWRKRVRRILGRAPLDSALQGRFGPGSTFSNRGNLITLAHKLSEDYTATRQAMSFLPVWDETAWSRYAACDLVGDPSMSSDLVGDPSGFMLTQSALAHSIRDFSVVRGNRFTTVDKDSRSKRGICVEPSLNLFFQLAIGSYLSKRMNRFLGWEKETAQDFHKSLARIGSLTGAISTLDLSRASDTVCTTLVKLLLPDALVRVYGMNEHDKPSRTSHWGATT